MGFLEIRKGETEKPFVRELYQFPFMGDFAELVRYRHVKVDDLAISRLFLEPEVCRLTAQKAPPKSLEEMQKLLDSYAHIKEREKLENTYLELLSGNIMGPYLEDNKGQAAEEENY